MPKLNFEERFHRLCLVYGEKQAREMIQEEYEAYELAHLDYQALIVVASMQQEFERLGILDYQRTHKPVLANHKFYERVLPGSIKGSLVSVDNPLPIGELPTISTEIIEAVPFQYHKEVNTLVMEIHRMYLGISHQAREVLYSDVHMRLRHEIMGIIPS